MIPPPALLACAAFLALGCAIFPGPVFLGEMILVTEPRATDILAFGLPFKLAFRKAVESGTFPLWSPQIYCGFPLHAEGEGSFLHPLGAAASLLLPSAQALTWTILLSLAAAGLLVMLYARELGFSWPACLLSACCFAYGGRNILNLHHPNHLLALAWTGLVFYAWEKFLKTRRRDWLILAGAGWALQILASYPAFAYYTFLAACAYALTRLSLTAWLKAVAVFTAVGLGLSAAQWLPTWELSALSARSGGLSYQESSTCPYLWKDLASWVRRDFMGGPWSPQAFERSVAAWENSSYIGIIPSALALWSLLAAARRPGPARFMAAMLAVSMALVLQTPLYRWLWACLPGFDYFRLSSRLLFPATFAAALLAGMGLDRLRQAFPKLPGLALLVLAASLLDLASFARLRYKSIDPRAWMSPPGAAAVLRGAAGRVGSVGWEGVFLAFAREALSGRGDVLKPYLAWKELLGMGAELTWGLKGSWSGYIALAPKTLTSLQDSIRLPWKDGRPLLDEAAANLLRVQAIEFLVAPGPLGGGQSELLRTYDAIPGGPRVWLHRLKNPLPRAFVAPERSVAPSTRAAIAALSAPGFDPSRTVILEEDSPQGERTAAGSSLRWIREKPARLTLEASMNGNGYLVLSDSWFPGWKAEVDGRPAAILRANGHFRALYLTRGQHRVSFSYEPWTFPAGAAVSLLTLLALAAIKHG